MSALTLTLVQKDDLLKKLDGRRVVLSVSGGKDSAAASLWLAENGIDHDRVFCDTGWEHPLTYEYLRGPLTAKLGPIVEIRAPLQMVDLIKSKAMFPSRMRRYCTQELKVKPMQAHLNKLVEQGHDIVNAVGIRASESAARAALSEWEWSDGFDCEVWRPLIKASEAEVILLHKRHGLAPNPLYLKGATRVGCWPCIHARKSEIKLMAEIDPGRIETIAKLEAEVTGLAKARYEARGETLGFHRGFFQSPFPDESGLFPPWPIAEAVKWSKTTRGGKQYGLALDMPEADSGCMRWGLCDTGAKSGGGEP